MNQSVTLTFTRERDTKNMARFQEDVAAGDTPKIGTLYVNKRVLPPAQTTISVTVTW